MLAVSAPPLEDPNVPFAAPRMFNRADSNDPQNRAPQLTSAEVDRIVLTNSQQDILRIDGRRPTTSLRRSPNSSSNKRVVVVEKPKRKRRPPKIPWKKPKDMPKRPLSAYNLFFAHERERLVKLSAAVEQMHDGHDGPGAMDIDALEDLERKLPSLDTSKVVLDESERASKTRKHMRTSGIGFANLAKTIGAKWKNLDTETRAHFERQAAVEKERYQREMVIWRSKKRAESEAHKNAPSSIVPKTPPRRSSEPLISVSSPEEIRPPQPRRLSDSVAQYVFDFDFDLGVTPPRSETSGLAASFDGGSLASSLPEFEDIYSQGASDIRASSFDVPRARRARPSPQRSYSDSMLHLRANFEDILRPVEELAADVRGMEESKEDSPISSLVNNSLQALQSSLDDETVDFLTNLPFQG